MVLVRGVRLRLLLVVALAALPALAVFSGLLAIESQQARERTRDEAQRQVELNAVAFEAFFAQTRGLLSAVAAAPVVRAGTDHEGLRGFLEQVVARNSNDYANLGLVDLDGNIVFSVAEGGTGVNVADRQWFKRAKTSRDFTIGDYIVSRVTNVEAIIAAAPVLDAQGEVRSLLFATLPLQSLQRRLLTPADATASNVLIDSGGRVLARQPLLSETIGNRLSEEALVKTILSRSSGIAEVEGLDGDERLYAFAPASDQRGSETLFVTSGIPTASAYGGLRTRLLTALGLVLAASIFAVIAAMVVSERSFVLPLRALSSATAQLASGDWSARSMLPRSDDEIGDLSREFDGMAAALQAHMTEIESARVELAQTNAELDDRVRHRTAELLAANRELESFSYSVSHDLRAPLRALDGFSQALLEDYGDRLDADGSDYLQRIRAAAGRMGELIDSLLQLSRLSRTEMHNTNVDMSALARNVAEELQASRGAHPVRLSVQPGLRATGDLQLVRLLLQNLIENAWKFTARRADAEVEVGEVVSEGVRAFFVRDNGAGFDMAYADKLFGAFQRLHSNNEFAGQGIGLATAARIVHRHGGEIWAEGRPDGGATFFFTLPGVAPMQDEWDEV